MLNIPLILRDLISSEVDYISFGTNLLNKFTVYMFSKFGLYENS